MQNRLLPAVVICISISSALGQPTRNAGAQSNWGFPEFIQATDAYRRGDCQTAWELMWPLAKAGRHEAIYFLWSSLVGKMIPPGNAASSPSDLHRHMLILAAYTAAGPKGANPFHGDPEYRWAHQEIPNLIAQLNFGREGQEVAQCYASNASFQECLRLAVKLDVF